MSTSGLDIFRPAIFPNHDLSVKKGAKTVDTNVFTPSFPFDLMQNEEAFFGMLRFNYKYYTPFYKNA